MQADDDMPVLGDAFVPPAVCGTADLTEFAYRGNSHDSLIERIDRFHQSRPAGVHEAALMHDAAIACHLGFRRADGLALQDAALERCQVFRVGAGGADDASPGRTLRLLALVGPGDLMVNAPLDFLTNHLDVRLDLLYLLPDRALPPRIPDHDVAFIAAADPAMGSQLQALYASWPRPVLNNPRCLPGLERDALARSLAGVAGICSPQAVAVARDTLKSAARRGAAHPADSGAARDRGALRRRASTTPA